MKGKLVSVTQSYSWAGGGLVGYDSSGPVHSVPQFDLLPSFGYMPVTTMHSSPTKLAHEQGCVLVRSRIESLRDDQCGENWG